jgi:hypothetical protein
MSEENFIGRWSRRKREAARAARNTAQPANSAIPDAPSSADNASIVPLETQSATVEDKFDPASLPPVESITATTDVTVFLRAGVPLEIRRAALRRAWESDPAIRDFIGPTENAWDFNDPNAIPGFGPLDQNQAREMAAKIVGKVRNAIEELPSADEKDLTEHRAESRSEQVVEQSFDREPSAAVESPSAGDHSACVASDTSDQTEKLRAPAALHNGQPVLRTRRTHGGALPR